MTERRYLENRIHAGLMQLEAGPVYVRRMILSDRHGKHKPALVEYTADEFAVKLADAIERAERDAYVAPESRGGVAPR